MFVYGHIECASISLEYKGETCYIKWFWFSIGSLVPAESGDRPIVKVKPDHLLKSLDEKVIIMYFLIKFYMTLGPNKLWIATVAYTDYNYINIKINTTWTFKLEEP